MDIIDAIIPDVDIPAPDVDIPDVDSSGSDGFAPADSSGSDGFAPVDADSDSSDKGTLIGDLVDSGNSAPAFIQCSSSGKTPQKRKKKDRIGLIIGLIALICLGGAMAMTFLANLDEEVKDEPFEHLEREYGTFFRYAYSAEATVDEVIDSDFTQKYYEKEHCWLKSDEKSQVCNSLVMGIKPIAEITYTTIYGTYHRTLSAMQLQWRNNVYPPDGLLAYPALTKGQKITVYYDAKSRDSQRVVYEGDLMKMYGGKHGKPSSHPDNIEIWYRKISNLHTNYNIFILVGLYAMVFIFSGIYVYRGSRLQRFLQELSAGITDSHK